MRYVKFSTSFLTLIVICQTPVQAQTWVDVLQGDNKPNAVWEGKQPVPGVNCPSGSTVYPMNYSAGPDGKTDTTPSHYSVVNGALVYTYTPPPPPPPSADAQSMENAIMADTTISEAAKLLMVPYFMPLVANQSNGALIQPLWTALINTNQLTSQDITTIENYASQYLVPLVSSASANAKAKRKANERLK